MKNKNGGGEPGIDSHVISRHDAFALTIGGFEFALDGMLNVHAPGVKYRKPTVALRKCNVPRPFVGKISSTCFALKMASYQVSCLDSVVQKRYRDKLSLLGLNEDEDPYQSMNFIDDMTLWPPVNYGDIFCYFIDRPGVYTKQQLLQWRSLEAYNYYQSGHVRTVEIWATKGDVCVLKALVNPSPFKNLT